MSLPLRSPFPGAQPSRGLTLEPDSPRPELLSSLLTASGEVDRDQAWARFLEGYSDLLLRSVRGLGTGYDDVMDRYVFVLDHLRAANFKRLRQFHPTGSARFTTWLVLVTRRLCLDHRRRRYGRRPPSHGGSTADARALRRRLADLVGAGIEVTELTDDRSPGADAVLASSERRRAIESILGGLEPRSLLLLRLRFGKGLTAREIAELMAFPSQFHVFRELKTVLSEIRRRLVEAGVDGLDA